MIGKKGTSGSAPAMKWVIQIMVATNIRGNNNALLPALKTIPGIACRECAIPEFEQIICQKANKP